MSGKNKGSTDTTICRNRRATYDYEIEDKIEAGIMLVGTEVKSLRAGKASINEAYAGEKGGELYLINANISIYDPAGRFNHDPKRARKLLVHKKELNKLLGASAKEGYTLVPMSLYFNARGIVKLQLGLGKGKKKADKRESEKERDWKRQKERLMRE